jgi:uncharacterized protein YcgI (DUF1989 family)
MLSIVDDDCGVHDLLFAPCNHWILEEYGQSDDHGCRENLAEALSRWDIPSHLIQEPMNVFMRTTVTNHNHVDVREPISEPGDTVSYRATTDTVVGVSACAAEGTVNTDTAGPIELKVPEDAPTHTNFE